MDYLYALWPTVDLTIKNEVLSPSGRDGDAEPPRTLGVEVISTSSVGRTGEPVQQVLGETEAPTFRSTGGLSHCLLCYRCGIGGMFLWRKPEINREVCLYVCLCYQCATAWANYG